MLRRVFIGGAAAGIGTAVASTPARSCRGLDALIEDIGAAVMSELPGVKRVQVTYDPDDEKVPLMIVAFRV